jgi:RHS repeat-associated protein
VTYQVEVYSDKHLTTLVASVSGLPGTLLTTAWTVTPALPKKVSYYWRVRAHDGQFYSAWSGTRSFKVGKLASGGNIRFAATKPAGLSGLRVATIGSLGGLTGGETEAIFFYQTDHLGTPLLLTDQTGQVVWKAEYLPFGEPVSVNEDVDGDGVKVVNNLRFPGQIHDTETGLSYNWNRYYDSTTGRYISSDPLGLLGGINTCTYAQSNPLRFTDPHGLFCTADFLYLYTHGFKGTLELGAEGLLDTFENAASVRSSIEFFKIRIRAAAAEKAKSLCNQCDKSTKSGSFTLNDWSITDVRHEPCLYSVGHSQFFRSANCSVSVDCEAKTFSFNCSLGFKIRDWFRDPLGIGMELGTPYRINADWSQDFSGSGGF